MPRPRLSLALVPMFGLLSLAGGCGYFSDGNPGASNDEYNYPSTSTVPQTLVLRDLRSDEVLYTWEIPVDQKLFVRFNKADTGAAPSAMPDTCEWIYYPFADWNPPSENHAFFKVPPASGRRLELVLRPSPELPSAMKPTDVPKPPDDLPPIK